MIDKGYYVGPEDKALWPAGRSQPVEDYIADGHHLFDGSISWPALVLREEALAHNIATLARFCAQHGLAFAPHGKTTMAPKLFRRQLAAGAWGITLATSQQARVARLHGIGRIMLAHELLDERALTYFAAEMRLDPSFEFSCFVDSPEGVAAAAAAGRAHLSGTGFPVILDIGYAGGRTGVRTSAEALRLAQLIADTDGVHLIGVNGYEGGLRTVDDVSAFFGAVREAVDVLAAAALLPESPIVTAGGSAYFDCVAAELGGRWARDRGALVILRSGAYISHDDGTYAHKTAYNRISAEGSLHAAAQIWAQVVSAPEPGLALVAMGKRDAPYDSGLPIPMAVRRSGTAANEPIDGRATVPKLDDQHCYLDLAAGFELRPGDLVCFGISHPCTAFDKWRAIPVVDADDQVVDVVRTYF